MSNTLLMFVLSLLVVAFSFLKTPLLEQKRQRVCNLTKFEQPVHCIYKFGFALLRKNRFLVFEWDIFFFGTAIK
jgi:hypothetical protein